MREVSTIGANLFPDGSCYVEITIDYITKKVSVKVVGVKLAQSKLDPYDDMLGLFTDIKSVVQYKIQGKWDKEDLVMITRIQCMTSDNCALQKLRQLLPNLVIRENRLKMFKSVKQLLNPPDSDDGSSLVCFASDLATEVTCSPGEKSCQYHRNKYGVSDLGCVKSISAPKFDIEYRFNVIEEMATDAMDTSPKAMKIFFTCNANHCNSENHLVTIDHLLTSLALGESSSSDKSQTNSNGEGTTPKAALNAQAGKSKSNSERVLASICYSLMTVSSALVHKFFN